MPHGPSRLVLTALTLLLAGLGDAARAAAPSPATPTSTPDRVSWLGGHWFLLGHNYPWHHYNYDFGDDAASNVLGSYARIDAQLAELRGYGTYVTRWYVFNDGVRYPLFDAQGHVSGLPAQFFENFDAALRLATAHDFYLIPVLWDSLVAERRTSAPRPRTTVITDPEVRQSYLDNALVPLLRRYGQHPRILAWSIINEPDWPAGFTNDRAFVHLPHATLREFIQVHARYIHTYTRQAAALDLGGLPWLDRWRDLDLDLDLYLAHWYPWIDHYYGAQHSPYNRTADSFNIDKPIVIAEFPLKNTPYSVQQSLDTFYAHGYAGALAWCYPRNNTDEYCDDSSYLATRETFRAWAQAHAAEVAIRSLASDR
jgi:hypothetical protein